MTEPKLNLEPDQPVAGLEPSATLSSRWKDPLLAVFLSLLIPGLGQLRNRQPQKGLLIGVISPLLLVFASYARLLLTFRGMLIFLALGILWSGFVCVDAFRSARHGREARKTFPQAKATFLVSGVLIAMLPFIDSAAYFLHKFGYYRAFKIPSASMCPTICEGDRIVADMDAFVGRAPQRGDVVMFKFGATKVSFIKRVIGVGGDVVSEAGGQVLVNGKPITTPASACGTPGTQTNDYDQPSGFAPYPG